MNRLPQYDGKSRLMQTTDGTFAGRQNGSTSAECFWIYSTGVPNSANPKEEYWVMLNAGTNKFKFLGHATTATWDIEKLGASVEFRPQTNDVGGEFVEWVAGRAGVSESDLLLHEHAVTVPSSVT